MGKVSFSLSLLDPFFCSSCSPTHKNHPHLHAKEQMALLSIPHSLSNILAQSEALLAPNLDRCPETTPHHVAEASLIPPTAASARCSAPASPFSL